MGYTHYFRTEPKALNPVKFKELGEKVKRIIEACRERGIAIGGGAGNGGEPEITKDEILFNGVGEDSHETLAIRRIPEAFDFCKTNRKPYDLAVITSLIAFQRVFSDDEGKTIISLSSDGEDEGCWNEAIELYESLFGKPKGGQ